MSLDISKYSCKNRQQINAKKISTVRLLQYQSINIFKKSEQLAYLSVNTGRANRLTTKKR